MADHHVAIESCGLVTSVGLSAPASCAAIRVKVSNPTRTRFIEPGHAWMTAAQVPFDPPVQGIRKLIEMAGQAIRECLRDMPKSQRDQLPILLCVAERDRPGRLAALDESILAALEDETDTRFAEESAIIAHGRVSVAVALGHASRLVRRPSMPRALIVATDSLLTGSTLAAYQGATRLRNDRNSNGFMAGEAAGALLVGLPSDDAQVLCSGVGFGSEPAHVESDLPLRAEGLRQAISQALAAAQVTMDRCPIRIADLSGEHYYFKEAALAMARIRQSTAIELADLWHPAECIGECGAAAGLAMVAVAATAFSKGYLPGDHTLLHMSNDNGARAALVLQRG